MRVESVNAGGLGATQHNSAGKSVEENRKRSADAEVASVEKNLVAPEEVLDKIKGLTEGGLHSVRFEMNQDLDRMIISVVNKEGEVVRQLPPEELIDSSIYLKELRGSLLNTES